MKKIIQEVVAWLNTIPKDKYQHFAVGALEAFLTLWVATMLLSFAEDARIWVAVVISVLVTLWIEVYKEYRVDESANLGDAVATMLGGACVWIPMLWIVL